MLVSILAGCGGSDDTSDSSDDSTVYRLSLTFHDSSEAVKTKFVQAWADEVYEATDGRVEITVYAGGTLASSTDALDAVKQGTADIGVCFTSFFPDQFPLTEVVSLPMTGIDNAVQGTNVLWDLWESSEALQEELSDYKVLMLYANPNNIICTNTPVYTADDMQGLKLRVSSGTPAVMAEAWGATPMTISSSEIYQSMEKSVIDGYLIDYTGVNSWNLYEVTDYFTEFPFYVAPWCVLMNMDSWNALPEDLQEIINSLSDRQRSLDFAQVSEDEAAETVETATNEYGCTIIELTDEQIATFQPEADEYIADWVEDYGTDTFDAQEYVDTVISLAEQYAE